MRILFVSDNFPPEVNAPATRTYEHCLEWVRKGAKVTVITCFPNFPNGKIFPGFRNRLIRKEMMDGIEVIRVWTYMAPNRGVFRRTVDYVTFGVASFIAGLFRKTDLIVATSPQFFSAVSGYMLSLFKRKPWVFELRDLWPDSIRSVGAVQPSLGLRMLEKLELFLYRRATVVVPNTHSFKSNLIERGIEANKIKVVTNGSNLDHYTPQPKNRKLMDQLGINGQFVVGYVGTIGMAHRLEFIIKAISRINDPDFFFLFVGDGARRREVEALSKDLKLDNVLFLDSVSKDMVPDYLSIIDAALIPLRKSETFKSVIPSKIFESAAMHKPILLGVDGEAKRLVTRYKAGACFVPEDETDFITKLKDLRDDKERYGELMEGCARLAKDYDRKKLAVEMLDILHEAAGVTEHEWTEPFVAPPVLSAARYIETVSNGTFGRVARRSQRGPVTGPNGKRNGNRRRRGTRVPGQP